MTTWRILRWMLVAATTVVCNVANVAFESYEGRYRYESISRKSRGRLRPMYEKVYNHYHNRKGLDAPYTAQAVSKVQPESGRRGSALPWGTLMFANQPATFP